VFGVFGNGEYRLQPIYVDDLARLAVEQGQAQANVIINAIGPETYTYRGLVRRIGELIGCRRPVVAVPPSLGYAVGWLLGKMLGDVMITRAEIAGLMQGLLAVDVPPVGETNLSDWVRAHAATLGRHYASELARRRNRVAAYEQL
jgi:NADH dehydrogenase